MQDDGNPWGAPAAFNLVNVWKRMKKHHPSGTQISRFRTPETGPSNSFERPHPTKEKKRGGNMYTRFLTFRPVNTCY